jgi:hypothetical protein
MSAHAPLGVLRPSLDEIADGGGCCEYD